MLHTSISYSAAEKKRGCSGIDGSGQTIGIIELGGGFRQNELDTYFNQLGVNPPKVKIANFQGCGKNSPGTDPLDPANADVEVLLDIEVAASIAPSSQIVVYFAQDASEKGFLDAITAAVHDSQNNPSIISISWGGPESNATNQFQQNFDQALEAAAALQVTVCVASGDNASADAPLDDPSRPWDGAELAGTRGPATPQPEQVPFTIPIEESARRALAEALPNSGGQEEEAQSPADGGSPRRATRPGATQQQLLSGAMRGN